MTPGVRGSCPFVPKRPKVQESMLRKRPGWETPEVLPMRALPKPFWQNDRGLIRSCLSAAESDTLVISLHRPLTHTTRLSVKRASAERKDFRLPRGRSSLRNVRGFSAFAKERLHLVCLSCAACDCSRSAGAGLRVRGPRSLDKKEFRE